MDRALVGDADQTFLLFGGQVAVEGQVTMEDVSAILVCVFDFDIDLLQIHALALRVHVQRQCSAGAERRSQQIVRREAGIIAAVLRRCIGDQFVRTDFDHMLQFAFASGY